MNKETQKQRRERIAIAAMQGLLASPNKPEEIITLIECIEMSIQCADELIKQLDK